MPERQLGDSTLCAQHFQGDNVDPKENVKVWLTKNPVTVAVRCSCYVLITASGDMQMQL